MASIEIHSIQSVSGNQPRMRRIIEEAGQSFLPGTPVQIAADGGVKAWDGATLANGIAGFSKEFGANLTTLGVAKQPGTLNVPNEPAAQTIYRPVFNDGRTGFEAAALDTIFLAQVGPAQTALLADVGKQYGMSIDTDNHWFVDKAKTGANVVCEIVKLDPNDQSATPRGVYIFVLPAASQLEG